ncbi:PepSY domain-containing protein [Glaciimonas sp. GG7]
MELSGAVTKDVQATVSYIHLSISGNAGSAGDIFMQAQFPLHSGRILGLTGRILISVMGAVVALLSATGLLIWLRKRRARMQQKVKLKMARVTS